MPAATTASQQTYLNNSDSNTSSSKNNNNDTENHSGHTRLHTYIRASDGVTIKAITTIVITQLQLLAATPPSPPPPRLTQVLESRFVNSERRRTDGKCNDEYLNARPSTTITATIKCSTSEPPARGLWSPLQPSVFGPQNGRLSSHHNTRSHKIIRMQPPACATAANDNRQPAIGGSHQQPQQQQQNQLPPHKSAPPI
ncbi:uncharacterized protein LOC128864801 [Anastrepha ludens]|uniref:uncharacterized protein LOC128864801 n=1 Tax=Anastrepha ludens TaxID=28586 RepID=UPI0023B02F6E|nr:uncharacterized protein LOC128864801 [Anastrepha ludens]